jgi:hypothetical protein
MKLYNITYKSNGFTHMLRVRALSRTAALAYFADAYPYYSDAQVVSEKNSVIV